MTFDRKRFDDACARHLVAAKEARAAREAGDRYALAVASQDCDEAYAESQDEFDKYIANQRVKGLVK